MDCTGICNFTYNWFLFKALQYEVLILQIIKLQQEIYLSKSFNKESNKLFYNFLWKTVNQNKGGNGVKTNIFFELAS